MTGIDTAFGQGDGGFPVDAREHAVAVDVGVDDGRDARALEFLRQLDDVEARRLGPALDRNLAAARVDADRDPVGEFPAGFLHEVRIANRDRAEDHPRQPAVQPGLDMLKRADAAAELDRVLRRLQDRLDGRAVAALAGKGAVEIDDVQPVEALVLESLACAAGSRCRPSRSPCRRASGARIRRPSGRSRERGSPGSGAFDDGEMRGRVGRRIFSASWYSGEL